MKFYLVRHAHADWSPDEDRPLSKRGHRDALRVADILDPFSIHGVISSPYRRAVQTVEPLASRKHLRIEKRGAFRERELGSYSIATFDKAVCMTWEDPDFAHPGGETNREAQMRGINSIQELLDGGVEEPQVIGTHGNLLTLILNYYDPSLGYGFWCALTMPDIYCLEVVGCGEVRIERIWNG
jgi:2,3-bisphosphoglycerate-dependent phosphoglycerate mutase